MPGLDARFVKIVADRNFTGYAGISEKTFGSNWSERHAAYVCGLGTFGLSKGLITDKGMGRTFCVRPDQRGTACRPAAISGDL